MRGGVVDRLSGWGGLKGCWVRVRPYWSRLSGQSKTRISSIGVR